METLPHDLVSQLALEGVDLHVMSDCVDADDGEEEPCAASVASSAAAASDADRHSTADEEGRDAGSVSNKSPSEEGQRAGKKGKKKGLKGVTISLDEFAEGGVTGLIDQKKAEHRRTLQQQQQQQMQMQQQGWAGAVPPPPPPPRGGGNGWLHEGAPEYIAASAGYGGAVPAPPPPAPRGQYEYQQHPILAALQPLKIDIAASESTPHLLLESINEPTAAAQFGSVEGALEAVLHEKNLLPLRLMQPMPGTGGALLSFFTAKQAYLALLLLHELPLGQGKLQASMLQDLPSEEWLSVQLQQLHEYANDEWFIMDDDLGSNDQHSEYSNSYEQGNQMAPQQRTSARAGVVELPTNLLEDDDEREEAVGPVVVLDGFRQAAVLGCNSGLLEQYRTMKSFKLKSSYLKDSASVCNPSPTAMLLLNLADCNLHGVWAAMGPEEQAGPGQEKYLEFSEVHPGAVLSPAQYGALLHGPDGQLAAPPMMLDAAATKTLLQLLGTAPEDPGVAATTDVWKNDAASPPSRPSTTTLSSATLKGSYRPYVPAGHSPADGSSRSGSAAAAGASARESSSEAAATAAANGQPQQQQQQQQQRVSSRSASPSPASASAPPQQSLPMQSMLPATPFHPGASMALQGPQFPQHIQMPPLQMHPGVVPPVFAMGPMPPPMWAGPVPPMPPPSWWGPAMGGPVPPLMPPPFSTPQQGGMGPPPPFQAPSGLMHHPYHPPMAPHTPEAQQQQQQQQQQAVPVNGNGALSPPDAPAESSSVRQTPHYRPPLHHQQQQRRSEDSSVPAQHQAAGAGAAQGAAAITPKPQGSSPDGAAAPEPRKGICRICGVNKSGYAIPGCAHYGPCTACVPEPGPDTYPNCLQCGEPVATMVRIY